MMVRLDQQHQLMLKRCVYKTLATKRRIDKSDLGRSAFCSFRMLFCSA
ncbi:unnamed protein product [Rhodiola kirilowii]